MDKTEKMYLAVYLPLIWCLELTHGMMNTVIGPSQLYLAKNVGLSASQINFVWTFGFLGLIGGSFATSALLKTWFQHSWQKILLIASSGFVSGSFMIVLPFITNPVVLFSCRTIQFFALGAMVTADTSMLVYMLGTVKSRPFVMAMHALIGIGFLLATFLVRPFLPTVRGSACDPNEKTLDSISLSQANSTRTYNEMNSNMPEKMDASMIHWPFVIVGSLAIIDSFCFALLLILPFKMPVYSYLAEAAAKNKNKKKNIESDACDITEGDLKEVDNGSRRPINYKTRMFFVILIFVYYVLTCGVERVFQPMTYSFGLCGPLQLSPSAAVLTDSTYNGGFMSGRILSIIIAKYVQPTTMIVVSLSTCILTSVVLCVVSRFSVTGLYIGTFLIGFFLASEFGGCVNWTAKKIDITGKVSSVFFVGCGIGSALTPLLTGYIFEAVGPMSIMYLTFIFCVFQAFVFATMWVIARKFNLR